ncbi:MAG: YfcL family protein [Oceanospirillaceae bacterium]|nr:YfcL family protein [Oceanospirillaceae bacterium]
MSTSDYSDRLHQYLLKQEESTDDADRLFYSSYLLGHLSLAAAADPASAERLQNGVDASLDDAFAVDHLSDADKAGIRSLWQEALAAAD